MLIREAKPADATAISKIHVDSWHSTYTGIVPQNHLDALTYEQKEEMWLSVLQPEHTTSVLVAESDSGIIGFVSVGPERGETNTGELFTLYVADSAQRCGAGSLLFSAGAQCLRTQGFTTMALWLLEGNTKGKAFYGKMGGKITGSKVVELSGVELLELRYEFLLSAV